MSRRIGWRLAVEPFGGSFAWSLFANRGDGAVTLEDAGIIPVENGLQDLVVEAVGAEATSGVLVRRETERRWSRGWLPRRPGDQGPEEALCVGGREASEGSATDDAASGVADFSVGEEEVRPLGGLRADPRHDVAGVW